MMTLLKHCESKNINKNSQIYKKISNLTIFLYFLLEFYIINCIIKLNIFGGA